MQTNSCFFVNQNVIIKADPAALEREGGSMDHHGHCLDPPVFLYLMLRAVFASIFAV